MFGHGKSFCSFVCYLVSLFVNWFDNKTLILLIYLNRDLTDFGSIKTELHKTEIDMKAYEVRMKETYEIIVLNQDTDIKVLKYLRSATSLID